MPASRAHPAPSTPRAQPQRELRVIEPICAVFRRKLRAEGLKYTTERARILDAVTQAPEPFTADQVIALLKSPGNSTTRGPAAAASSRVSKATVYRTIKLLAEAGIVHQVLLQADLAHYQLAYGRDDTAMLIRTDQQHAEAVAAPDLAVLAERICAERGLRAEGYRFVVYARKP